MNETPCSQSTRNSKDTAWESTHNAVMTAHDLSFWRAAISLPEFFEVIARLLNHGG